MNLLESFPDASVVAKELLKCRMMRRVETTVNGSTTIVLDNDDIVEHTDTGWYYKFNGTNSRIKIQESAL